MRTYQKTCGAAVAAALLCLATGAGAHEPGVPTAVPSGASMGVPAGASPPPGLYFSSRTGFADFTLYDQNGDPAGAEVTVKDTAL